MVDRVQVIKWESISEGGSQDDSVPTEINSNEDGLDMRSAFLQNDTSSDKAVNVSRDASDNMTFEDPVVGEVKTLADLLAGGSAFNPDLLLFTSDGGLIYNNSGEPLLKENS